MLITHLRCLSLPVWNTFRLIIALFYRLECANY